jgi:hydrogenase maturation protein HypF
MQLEYLATARIRTSYPTRVVEQDDVLLIDPEPIIRGVVNDLVRGTPVSTIATKFHNSIIAFSLDTCKRLRRRYNINRVALSGGSFQNRLLLSGLTRALKTSGFVPVFHQKVPYNDGGISLGQVIIANNHVSSHRR